MNKTITPTTYALIAGLATLLISSLSEALAGIHPYVSANHIDYAGLVIYISVTFLPSLGASVVAFLVAHKQQLVQAAVEEAQVFHLPKEIETLLQDVKMFMQINQQQPTPQPTTMTVNVHPASQMVATTQSEGISVSSPVVTTPQDVKPVDASTQNTVPQNVVTGAQQLVFSGVATTDDTQPRAAVQLK